MGLAVLLETGRPSKLDFARALRPLAGFGLIHGSHEWFEMFLIIQGNSGIIPNEDWIAPIRIILLATSFLFLIAFGIRLIIGPGLQRRWLIFTGLISIIWMVGFVIILISTSTNNPWINADVFTRYVLALPGTALSVWGLIIQRKSFIMAGMHNFGRDVTLGAIAFGLYGGIGQVFVSPSSIFPSNFLNSEVFLQWFGIPIQVFRSAMATLAAIFIIRSLRAFEVECSHNLQTLQQAHANEQRRLDELRAELLHRTVKAQENERQRIARELHDGTGQTLTALGMGLRGIAEGITTHPTRAVEQAQQLEALALGGIKELQRIVLGLHPPQLDDLGLLAALRWYITDISQHSGIPIHLHSEGPKKLILSSELRSVIFRIAQEAITNIIRHSKATRADVYLTYSSSDIYLRIEDDGQGFDVDRILQEGAACSTCWGLLGMQERAALVGGTCSIHSQPGKGTNVEVHIPFPGEAISESN